MQSSGKSDVELNLAEVNELVISEQNHLDFVDFSLITSDEVMNEEVDLIALNIANSFDSLTLEEVAKDGLSDTHLDFVVDKILSALVDISNLSFKGSSYIEPDEINKVKKVLSEEQCSAENKTKIENELTKFQEKITSDYKESVHQYKDIRVELEAELYKLEDQKKSIVSKRISLFKWPYNSVTRAIDDKIYRIKCKLQSCNVKIETIESMRPAAKEKDILIFKMHLKEKFSKYKLTPD